MKQKTIVISDRDELRLRQLLADPQLANAAGLPNLERLSDELDRARVLPQEQMPPDAVTLGSTVEIEDLEDGEIQTYTLALPQDADVNQGRISILAPLGTGMLGYSVGDEFEWPVPTGTIRVRIRRIVRHASSPVTVAS